MTSWTRALSPGLKPSLFWQTYMPMYFMAVVPFVPLKRNLDVESRSPEKLLEGLIDHDRRSL